MTSHAFRECKHCGIRYSYQRSGHGCFDETNDETYCRECKKVIIKALINVPKKFETKFIECNDFTREEAINETDRYNQDLLMHRVFPCMYDTRTQEYSKDRYFEKDGEKYYVHYWNSRPDWFLQREVRWDILNNCEAD